VSDLPEQQIDAPVLQSGVLIPPGEKHLSDAIAATLRLPPGQRAAAFEKFARRIEAIVAAEAPGHPWTCTLYRGTDGSHVFRGGAGHSLVVDPLGRLWRALNYEHFETAYDISPDACTITALTPRYEQPREYLPR
jgi:hypothetical protein